MESVRRLRRSAERAGEVYGEGLLLDEPAAGVPRGESAALFAAISGLARDIAVLVIEHDMNVVFRFASRTIVMVGGRVLVESIPDEIGTDPRVREVYLGRARHA